MSKKNSRAMMNKGITWTVIFGALCLLTISTIVIATAFGGVNVPIKQTVQILLDQIPFINIPIDETYRTIILDIRLPRVLVAGLVGAAFAISGTVMQGVFRNPMADPGIIGVSTGGAFGAVAAIFSGIATIHFMFIPIIGFICSVLTLFIVYTISTNQGQTSVVMLLLTGIAVSAFLSSMTSLLISFANLSVMQQIVFWLMGDLAEKSWIHFVILLVPISFGVTVLTLYAKDLDVMLLGEDAARNMGVNLQKTRSVLLISSSLLVGISVSLTGAIGFIGLVVPHMMRLLIGPAHRYLLPASALGGAIFLILSDCLARILIKPAEIQVGIITAFFGAPFFLYLIWRKKKKGELS